MVNVIGSALSVMSLTIALSLFVFLRNMNSDRVLYHINLFISCWLLQLHTLGEAVDSHIQFSNDTFINKPEEVYAILQYTKDYFVLSNTFWTTCEATYIFLAAYRVWFDTNLVRKWLFIFGWCTAIPLLVIYAIMIHFIPSSDGSSYAYHPGIANNTIIASESRYHEVIIEVPMVFALVVNLSLLLYLFFFITFGTIHMEPSAVRGFRALAILTPLLGVHHLILDTPVLEHKVKSVILAFTSSFQGVVLSFLFCFTNQEVQREIAMAIRRNSTFIKNSGTRWPRSGVTSSFSAVHTYYGTNV